MSASTLLARSRPLFVAALVAAVAGCLDLIRHEAPSGEPVRHYGLRLGLVACCLAGWFLTQAMIQARPMDGERIGDGLHTLFAPLNRRLNADPKLANALLIVSSAFIDAFGLFLIIASILGPSVRPFAALFLLFGMRQVSQGLCALPQPPGLVWRHPGFPSLLVTYSVGNDFFFSGHTAIAVLGALELSHLSLWLGLVGWLVALGEMVAVLALRAHYTMDIVMALAAAFCALQLAGMLGV